MTAIAVTGAAGSVGRRVVASLAADPSLASVKALDREPMWAPDGVETHRVDLVRSEIVEMIDGARTIVHLAEDAGRRTDAELAATTLRRVLSAAERADVGHVVLLSSALVYGAYADNPIPLTERSRRRPIPSLAYAATKTRLEEIAEGWATDTGAGLAVLRPTTTLSERGVSYIAGALRAATTIRSEAIDPPVQFLHHDDLASAVALVATRGLDSVYNVAPDGWIGPEVFRDLLSDAELHWPEPVDEAITRAAQVLRPRLLRSREVAGGLEAYVSHPWVVANGRLRAAGWEPAFTNEEAFVLGNPQPMWRTVATRRRQELALGVVGAATIGAVGAMGFIAQRLTRGR